MSIITTRDGTEIFYKTKAIGYTHELSDHLDREQLPF